MEETYKTGKTWKQEAREVLRILVISLAVVLPIRIFIAQPFLVSGASMEPNYSNGEYIVVDQISYRFSPPARGETIIFRYPNDPSQFFIKRIVGLPGETVSIKDGSVVILNGKYPDGIKLSEPYLRNGEITVPNEVVTLGPDEYFVMGDNRKNSSDSRYWGNLDRKFIVGRAFVRLWPFTRITFL